MRARKREMEDVYLTKKQFKLIGKGGIIYKQIDSKIWRIQIDNDKKVKKLEKKVLELQARIKHLKKENGNGNDSKHKPTSTCPSIG